MVVVRKKGKWGQWDGLYTWTRDGLVCKFLWTIDKFSTTACSVTNLQVQEASVGVGDMKADGMSQVEQ